MKKTYVTKMPDHIGAFLKASKCFSAIGINITRVSYNKAVDSHTLFIDAEGTEEQHRQAVEELRRIGYLENNSPTTSVVLLEFTLRDVPGSVTDVLSLINEYSFNISYISSQENGTDHQYFKMGLYVDDADKIQKFLSEVKKICQVRVIDYNSSEKVYDNSIFYSSYVMGLAGAMELSDEVREKLLVNVNLAMQTLDEEGLSPYRTFDSISKFADLLAASRKDKFAPRISEHDITENTKITVIEPPCGSNTAIIKSGGEYLFVDSGYACYREEMLPIIKSIVPNFDNIKKRILVTHADLDHCGLLPMFDEIITSAKSAECMRLEYNGDDGYRERKALHKPYINICKMLTAYESFDPDKITVPWEDKPLLKEPLTQIGFFDFGELHFEVYEGKGGHLPGEIVLIDYSKKIAFTGDIYINMKGMTAEQKAYNQYAPILMTSVDTEPKLCTLEREAVMERLGVGNWRIFGGHGSMKDYSVNNKN